MRLLLIAYEFPPSPSPGSLRWHYLSRELAGNGFQLDVLAPALPGSEREDALRPNIAVHRTFAGPFCGLLRGTSLQGREIRPEFPSVGGTAAGLNWKGRLARRLKLASGFFLFPDVRAEWQPWARSALRQLLVHARPDLVISAHEPATTLSLGLEAARSGIPWIADLGDPIVAPYTPNRWRRKAAKLEAEICTEACHVVVTTERAKRQLMERHGLLAGRVSVITQGFDDHSSDAAGDIQVDFEPNRLELLYVGRFYPFRRPHELLEAVRETQGVRLTIASPEMPRECEDILVASSGKIRFLGEVSHAAALALQRRADVLVSIGNDGMDAQVPGKLYEYLGAGRPILHLLATGDADPAGELIRTLGVGQLSRNRREDLRLAFEALQTSKRHGTLAPLGRDRGGAHLEYSWRCIGTRYSNLIADYIRGTASPR